MDRSQVFLPNVVQLVCGARLSRTRVFPLRAQKERDICVCCQATQRSYLLFSHICAAGIYYDVKGMVAVPTCVWRIILIV